MSEIVEDVIAFYRMFTSFEREEICCGTVTQAQCVLLQTLMDGEWDVSSLAAHVRVTKGAMTRLIDGLESKGWVSRRRAKNDARRVVIELTGQGKREARRLARLTERSIGQLLDKIPDGERTDVARAIHLLRVAAERTRFDCC